MVGEELLKEIFSQDWVDVHCLRGSPLCLLMIFFFPFTSQEKYSTAHHFATAHKGRLNVGTGPLLFLTTSLCGYQEQTLPRLSRQPAMIQSFPERSVSLANNHPLALSRCWTEQPITGELRKHDIIVHIVQPVHIMQEKFWCSRHSYFSELENHTACVLVHPFHALAKDPYFLPVRWLQNRLPASCRVRP